MDQKRVDTGWHDQVQRWGSMDTGQGVNTNQHIQVWIVGAQGNMDQCTQVQAGKWIWTDRGRQERIQTSMSRYR